MRNPCNQVIDRSYWLILALEFAVTSLSMCPSIKDLWAGPFTTASGMRWNHKWWRHNARLSFGIHRRDQSRAWTCVDFTIVVTSGYGGLRHSTFCDVNKMNACAVRVTVGQSQSWCGTTDVAKKPAWQRLWALIPELAVTTDARFSVSSHVYNHELGPR